MQTLNLPTANKSKDGLDSYEYFEDDVQDNVYEAVLKQAYLMYKLFSGPYQDTVDKTDIATLKQKLEHFFTAVSDFSVCM